MKVLASDNHSARQLYVRLLSAMLDANAASLAGQVALSPLPK